MKRTRRILVVCLCLVLVAPGLLPAQNSSEDMKARIDELEKLILQLKAEVAAMKESSASAPAATATAQAFEVGAAPASEAQKDGRLLIASVGVPPVPTPPEKPQGIATGSTTPSSPSLASLLGPTSLTGYVDAYYGYNANHPSTLKNGLYSFNRFANQFGLGLVQLQVDKAPSEESRTGYRVSLGFGQAMTGLSELDPGETSGIGFSQYLMEGYFSYLAPVGKGLQVDVGKFVTPVGVELIPAKDNWNYSRGLLFSWMDPYFHFGMRAKYTINPKLAVSGFLVNGWNNILDTNSGKTYAGQIALTPSSRFGITQTYMAGPEGAGNNTDWRHLSDTIVTISPTSKLSFVFNGIVFRGDRLSGIPDPTWAAGGAGFVRYTLSDNNALAGRYEYLNDHYGFSTGTAQHIHGLTGTFERRIAHNIITRWEYRRDFSNQPFFLKGASTLTKAQSTVTAGLMFTFDSREAK